MSFIKAGWSGTVSINGKAVIVYECNACNPFNAYFKPCRVERSLSEKEPVNCVNTMRKKEFEKEIEILEQNVVLE